MTRKKALELKYQEFASSIYVSTITLDKIGKMTCCLKPIPKVRIFDPPAQNFKKHKQYTFNLSFSNCRHPRRGECPDLFLITYYVIYVTFPRELYIYSLWGLFTFYHQFTSKLNTRPHTNIQSNYKPAVILNVVAAGFPAKATLFTCCHHIPRNISTNSFRPLPKPHKFP
jgi:hypothetical protein